MDYNAQLKLQAWLDGELPEVEASQVSGWVARERAAADLAEELRQTRKALGEFEADIRLPETREFYWSKIEREIARLEAPVRKPDPDFSFRTLFQRFLVPASAVAVVVIAGLVLSRPAAPGRMAEGGIETALADAGAFTYHDYSAGTTLVWLSYPADKEVAEGDEIGTVQ